MIIKYSNLKKLFNNLLFRLLPPSIISNEGKIEIKLKAGLVSTIYNDFSDVEWLKEKNRILDGRTEYRKLMESINNGNTHQQVI